MSLKRNRSFKAILRKLRNSKSFDDDDENIADNEFKETEEPTKNGECNSEVFEWEGEQRNVMDLQESGKF